MGGAPQASIRMGEQNMNEAERILGNCFAALIILAVTLTAAFLIGGRTLLQLFGAKMCIRDRYRNQAHFVGDVKGSPGPCVAIPPLMK